jgi:hypothetical protein
VKKYKIGDKINFLVSDYPNEPVIYKDGTVIDIGTTEFVGCYIYKVTHPDLILHVNGVWISDLRVLDK